MNRQSIGTTLLVLVASVSLTGCSLLGQLEAAQELPALDGRVELPEAGIAVTFPDDWLLDTRRIDDVVGLASAFDPESQAMLAPVVAAVPGHRHDRCVVVDATPMVQARWGRPALAEVVAELEALLGSDPHWVDLDAALIDLPAGRAGRILRKRLGESEAVSTYVFTQADAWFYLECVAHSDSAGNWRSIAKTFEFLPVADGLPTPTPEAQAFLDSMCTAFDELLMAVGDPDTGEGSELSLALDNAIARGDEA